MSPNMPRSNCAGSDSGDFALIFAVIALTNLMAAILIGLNFANWLVTPIRRLMMPPTSLPPTTFTSRSSCSVRRRSRAARRNLQQMTQELRTQRDEHVSASDLIDSRRRFIEAVLSSASAGIIGVDASGSVGILNRPRKAHRSRGSSDAGHHPLTACCPIDDMMETAHESASDSSRARPRSIATAMNAPSVRVSGEQTS